MSTATEISRQTAARNTIRDKLIDLGLAASTDKLDTLATAVDGISNRGAVSATVQEGDTYTIPAGYHNGSGTVSGVAGGGNYSLQSKTCTPTKSQQSITPDSGYYGISDVTVAAIPEAYQNVSGVTATAGEVLSGKVIVDATGATITGTMPNNGAVNQTLTTASGHTSYTVPAGYHNGSGTVKIVTETKTVTPADSSQDVTPTTGKVLSKVTVGPIPSNYGNTTGDDAVAANILSGKKAHSNDDGDAVALTGTMANNGAVSQTLDATTGNQSYTVPAGYHNGSGAVNIVLETKSATPTTASQDVTPTAGKVLSKVTVNAIPSQYKDTSTADAVAADVLEDKIFVNGTGPVTGTMTNNGAVSASLDATTGNQSYTIPAGYHNGSGTVTITLETKQTTPTTGTQYISPTNGKVLSRVTVNPIPDWFGDIRHDDAEASHILQGKKAHSSNGEPGSDEAAVALTGTMPNNGAVSKTLDATTSNQTYTVPAGYHNGSGTVNIVLEEKSATPTTSSQNITPTAGKVLKKVTVAAIPSQYKDTTNADAVAGDVLAGKVFVNGTGEVTGTMPDNGTVTKVLDATTGNQSQTIAAGKHSGSGSVSIVLEEKSATPTPSAQNITPTAGKVLSKVTVNAIPAKYGDTTGDTAVAANLLAGATAHTISAGAAVQITGTMPNNGAISASIDGLTTTSYSVPAGYTTGGTVSLTDDIETALAAI